MLYRVTVSVSNTGSVPGAAVPQIYLSLPQAPNTDPNPVKVLRGFEKISLLPGQSDVVTFDLMRRDLSYWDTTTQLWTIAQGEVGVMGAFSSRDIRATASFNPLG